MAGGIYFAFFSLSRTRVSNGESCSFCIGGEAVEERMVPGVCLKRVARSLHSTCFWTAVFWGRGVGLYIWPHLDG